MKPIIKSLLDTDWYKITMNRIFFYRFSDVVGEYAFICRTPNVVFTSDMVKEIKHQIDELCKLRFSEDEIEFIKSVPYMTNAVGYLEFLKLFQLNRDFITISQDGPCGLEIRARGPLWAVSPFEIYVLAIVNEVYFKHIDLPHDLSLRLSAITRLKDKLKNFYDDPFPIMEFGTRRRLSFDNQQYVIKTLINSIPQYFKGTSNILFSKKFNLKPQGTFAHEYVCMPQGLNDCSLRNSQRYAWDQWCREFRGDIGSCLTDTLGQKKFEQDFDKYWANMFTSLRHDSGDPIKWGNRAIDIYHNFGIDPMTKTLIFSDSLNFETARKIYHYFKDTIRTVFGIGTFLTNDTDVWPLNIVMKLVSVNNRPVAKLSNNPGKTTCEDAGFVKRLQKEITT
jgi:nicotinate phosphoribosyltransferase